MKKESMMGYEEALRLTLDTISPLTVCPPVFISWMIKKKPLMWDLPFWSWETVSRFFMNRV